jgi:hypothetical protein
MNRFWRRMAPGAAAHRAFPREMAVCPDGRTLFLSNSGSRSLQVLQVIDIGNLPMVK